MKWFYLLLYSKAVRITLLLTLKLFYIHIIHNAFDCTCKFCYGVKHQVVGLSKVVFSWRTFYSATLCILLILWTICVSLSRSLTNTSLWKQADKALWDMSLSNADRNIYLTLTVKTILRSWYFLLLWISQGS